MCDKNHAGTMVHNWKETFLRIMEGKEPSPQTLIPQPVRQSDGSNMYSFSNGSNVKVIWNQS